MFRRLKYLLPHIRRREEREMEEELAALREIAGPRELGNLTLAAENARAVWGWTWLESVMADFRYAFRVLRRDRSFTGVAVISLALGIGANVAIFSLMDAVLWRELPVREPERLVVFRNSSGSYFGYTRFAEGSSAVLENLAGVFDREAADIDAGAGPVQGQVAFVTGDFFQTLGVDAAQGRMIGSTDDRRGDPSPVAVVSHSYWRRALAGGPVTGKTIRVAKAPFTIIGVAPPEFFGVTVGLNPDVWLPVNALPRIASSLAMMQSNPLEDKNRNFLDFVGRLQPGVSIAQAAAALTPLGIQIDLERNGPPKDEQARRRLLASALKLEPMTEGLSILRRRHSKPLQIVFGMVAICLLLACANVMSLQLARADQRRKELTVRMAIGAGRWRITRQLLTESLVVAGASGLLGLALYRPLAEGILRFITVNITGAEQGARLTLLTDSKILLFAVGVSLAVALVSGVAPALRATRDSTLAPLQHAARTATTGLSRKTVARFAAVAQMALSLTLIAAACLFAYSLYLLRESDVGVSRDSLLVTELDLRDTGANDEAAILLNERLRDRLAAIPGVHSASFSQLGVFFSRSFSTLIDADGYVRPGGRGEHAAFDLVGPDFFTTAGTHIAAGRDFTARDTISAPKVAVINEELAARLFKNGSPIGRNLYINLGGKKRDAYEVVGLVRNIKTDARRTEPRAYLSQMQIGRQAFNTCFLIRTNADATTVISNVRAAVKLESPALQIVSIDTANDLFGRTLSTDRLMAALASGFGILAIILAAAGIYGLLSYDVTRRTGEFGIRAALGAGKGQIVGLVMRETLLILALGTVIGLAATLFMAKLVESLVFQVKPTDPWIQAGAVAILSAVAVFAAWIPARRAARMDPMNALRHE